MANHTVLSRKRGLFAELRRRNVFRAAAIYGAAVWALSQGIAQLAPVFSAPDWTTRWFVIACAIGFPFWVAFAWLFEITPAGVKRESEVDPARSIVRHTGRKLDFWIIGILALAVVLLVTNQFVLRRGVNSVARTANAKAMTAEFAKIPFKSVAVLPLANDSGNPRQRYFSDGLSAQLISDLTQINGLKVIGRASSFQFRDSKESPAQIGVALGVAHLIQGSVQQQGGRIRVIVSMVDAKDGASAWSHTYDEQLKDVFAIQAKIGDAVAAALKVKLLGKPIVDEEKPPNGSVEAYKLMLQGRTVRLRGTEDSFRQSIALFQQALKLAPKYAYTWGLLSNAWVNLGFLSGDARQRAYVQARAAVDREQLLAPDAAHTYIDRGYLLANVDNDLQGALAEYKRAHALDPNNIAAMNFLASGLENTGQLQAAVEMYQKILTTDPLRIDVYSNLALALLGQHKLDAAERITRKALALQPGFSGLYATLTEIDVLRGDAKAARSDAAKETDPAYGPWARTLAQQIGSNHRGADAALRKYVAKQGKDHPYFVADLYALRKQPDKMFDWLQRAWAQRDPTLASSLLNDPFVLAYQYDPRFAVLCRQAGLPVPSQPSTADTGANGH